jgi:hypothetical protein
VDLLDRLRAWTHRRQRLGDPARSLLQALAAVVGVYATHPTAPLALRARARTFSAGRYRALDSEGRGLRVPAMRGTVFLVPRRSAARVFTAVRASDSRVSRSLRRHGLTTEDYERLARTILPAARDPMSAGNLREATRLDGPALGSVLRCLRYDGRLLALAGEGLTLGAHRYVATSAWAPEGLDAGDQGGALRWLAGEYLRAYGPARVEDFAWWAGVGQRAASRAIEPHPTVDVGDGLLLPASDLPSFREVTPVRGAVDLLPRWDPYTMGHAPDGRGRFVHPDVQERVYTPIGVGLPGDGNPVVLVDGQAVATWTFTLKDGPAVQPFDTLGPVVRRRVEEQLGEIAALLRG